MSPSVTPKQLSWSKIETSASTSTHPPAWLAMNPFVALSLHAPLQRSPSRSVSRHHLENYPRSRALFPCFHACPIGSFDIYPTTIRVPRTSERTNDHGQATRFGSTQLAQ